MTTPGPFLKLKLDVALGYVLLFTSAWLQGGGVRGVHPNVVCTIRRYEIWLLVAGPIEVLNGSLYTYQRSECYALARQILPMELPDDLDSDGNIQWRVRSPLVSVCSPVARLVRHGARLKD